jgi:ABC-type lipoprotein export system ATPase subunit
MAFASQSESQAQPHGALAIDVRDLDFRYGADFRLQIPKLEVFQGERLAFVGASGCGKTTLLSILSGILPADSGRVEVLGRELSVLNEAARRAFRISQIGLVFQEFELLEYLTGWENLLLPFRLNRALRLDSSAKSYAADLAKTLGIFDLLHRRPEHLSQGERQRLSLGRALVHKPQCILCDEPTGNLDPDATSTSLDLLFETAQGIEATVVVVTHNHQILPGFDRVVDVSSWSQRGASL